MLVVSVLAFLAGIGVVGVILLDVFFSVVVPRPTGRRWRPSGFLIPWLWRRWASYAQRFVAGTDEREDFLGAFGPFALVASLVLWISGLVTGYGFAFYGLRDQLKPVPGFGDAAYFAGTSLLTIGYGDFEPTGGVARLLSLAAGASGLATFAITTTFLFAIFGAYQQREAFVVLFTNRAGAPPSAVDMIETHANLNITGSLTLTMRESQLWMAQLLETHLAYPILTYFRSTHDDISWVAVLGTILDASTFAVTTLDGSANGEAYIVNRLGRHVINDFVRYFSLPAGDGVGIERGEFDAAYDRLRAARVPLKDRDAAWADFSAIRTTYARSLNEMARYWRIPPSQWIGDRSLIGHHPPLDPGRNPS